MITINFKNENDSRIKLHFYDVYDDIDIEPKKAFKLALNQNDLAFLVKGNALENSFIEKIAGIILTSIISVILRFLNYFEKDTIEDQIEFPTEFNIDDLTEN